MLNIPVTWLDGFDVTPMSSSQRYSTSSTRQRLNEATAILAPVAA